MTGTMQIANLWAGFGAWGAAGNLLEERGIVQSVAQLGVGAYVVTLSEDVVIGSVTAGASTHEGFAAANFALGLPGHTVVQQGGQPNQVQVATFDTTGAPTDAARVQLWIMALPTVD